MYIFEDRSRMSPKQRKVVEEVVCLVAGLRFSAVTPISKTSSPKLFKYLLKAFAAAEDPMTWSDPAVGSLEKPVSFIVIKLLSIGG